MGQAYLSGALRSAGHDTNILHVSEWLDYAFDVDRIDVPIVLGGIHTTLNARPLKDITTMPWMDLENWPHFQRIAESRRGWVNVYMNRGCPYRCTYCHNNGVAKVLQEGYGTKTSSNKALGYPWLRGIDDMLGEQKHIANRFPFVSAFSFNDDTFTMDQDHM